jgi:hypothetical protein
MAQDDRSKARSLTTRELHPKEVAFLTYIRRLGFGTIHRLVIQDGLPVFAEEVSQHIKFSE